MTGRDLESVVESLQDRVGTRSDWGNNSDTQTALVVSCSMSSCKCSSPLWPADATWNLVGVQTLGNQTQDRYEGNTVLNRTIEHLRQQHDITAVLVVGHTRCEILEDAYDRWVAPNSGSPVGIEAQLKPLCSLVGDGFEEGVVAESLSRQMIQYRLVEYNVRRQVLFLLQALPSSVTVAGYVHDQDGAYSSFPDKRHLVAFGGATDPATVREHIPEDASVRVASLFP